MAAVPKTINLTVDYLRSGRIEDTQARATITKQFFDFIVREDQSRAEEAFRLASDRSKAMKVQLAFN